MMRTMLVVALLATLLCYAQPVAAQETPTVTTAAGTLYVGGTWHNRCVPDRPRVDYADNYNIVLAGATIGYVYDGDCGTTPTSYAYAMQLDLAPGAWVVTWHTYDDEAGRTRTAVFAPFWVGHQIYLPEINK